MRRRGAGTLGRAGSPESASPVPRGRFAEGSCRPKDGPVMKVCFSCLRRSRFKLDPLTDLHCCASDRNPPAGFRASVPARAVSGPPTQPEPTPENIWSRKATDHKLHSPVTTRIIGCFQVFAGFGESNKCMQHGNLQAGGRPPVVPTVGRSAGSESRSYLAQ